MSSATLTRDPALVPLVDPAPYPALDPRNNVFTCAACELGIRRTLILPRLPHHPVPVRAKSCGMLQILQPAGKVLRHPGDPQIFILFYNDRKNRELN